MCGLLTSAVSEAGIGAVLGFLLSWVVEWFPAWDTLAARVKRLVMFGACFAIGLALWGIGIGLGCATPSIEGAWAALVAAFAAFTANQAAHTRDISNVKPADMPFCECERRG